MESRALLASIGESIMERPNQEQEKVLLYSPSALILVSEEGGAGSGELGLAESLKCYVL